MKKTNLFLFTLLVSFSSFSFSQTFLVKDVKEGVNFQEAKEHCEDRNARLPQIRELIEHFDGEIKETSYADESVYYDLKIKKEIKDFAEKGYSPIYITNSLYHYKSVSFYYKLVGQPQGKNGIYWSSTLPNYLNRVYVFNVETQEAFGLNKNIGVNKVYKVLCVEE